MVSTFGTALVERLRFAVRARLALVTGNETGEGLYDGVARIDDLPPWWHAYMRQLSSML